MGVERSVIAPDVDEQRDRGMIISMRTSGGASWTRRWTSRAWRRNGSLRRAWSEQFEMDVVRNEVNSGVDGQRNKEYEDLEKTKRWIVTAGKVGCDERDKSEDVEKWFENIEREEQSKNVEAVEAVVDGTRGRRLAGYHERDGKEDVEERATSDEDGLHDGACGICGRGRERSSATGARKSRRRGRKTIAT